MSVIWAGKKIGGKGYARTRTVPDYDAGHDGGWVMIGSNGRKCNQGRYGRVFGFSTGANHHAVSQIRALDSARIGSSSLDIDGYPKGGITVHRAEHYVVVFQRGKCTVIVEDRCTTELLILFEFLATPTDSLANGLVRLKSAEGSNPPARWRLEILHVEEMRLAIPFDSEIYHLRLVCVLLLKLERYSDRFEVLRE